MKIEEIRIQNYKVLKDVVIKDIPDMAVFLGANGTGKTTLFDVFGFLHDCLINNVSAALAKRGGYKEVLSRGESGDIEIEVKFRTGPGEPRVTYILQIGPGERGTPIVKREILKYRRGQHGRPWHFLDFSNGAGTAIVNEEQYGAKGSKEKREEQRLNQPDILAIKGLGQFKKFKAISEFRKFIEDWHVSDFHIEDARMSRDAGYSEHLSATGDNLPLVAKYMYDNYPHIFQSVLVKMARRVPGVKYVDATETADGRIVLRFQDSQFKDPFIARYVSDGTIKMFAYLLLMSDPDKHSLLCIEEPENQLYPRLLKELAEEFRAYARGGGQVFISTHSPDFVNGVEIDELYWLVKKDGFTEIRQAKDHPLIVNLVNEGDLLGYLWKQELLEGADPL